MLQGVHPPLCPPENVDQPQQVVLCRRHLQQGRQQQPERRQHGFQLQRNDPALRQLLLRRRDRSRVAGHVLCAQPVFRVPAEFAGRDPCRRKTFEATHAVAQHAALKQVARPLHLHTHTINQRFSLVDLLNQHVGQQVAAVFQYSFTFAHQFFFGTVRQQLHF